MQSPPGFGIFFKVHEDSVSVFNTRIEKGGFPIAI